SRGAAEAAHRCPRADRGHADRAEAAAAFRPGADPANPRPRPARRQHRRWTVRTAFSVLSSTHWGHPTLSHGFLNSLGTPDSFLTAFSTHWGPPTAFSRLSQLTGDTQ